MKNAKRLFALILGVLMLMGCLSVSAANSALSVTDNITVYYDDDASSGTYENVQKGNFANVVLSETGIPGPIYFEFDVSHVGLTDMQDAQIQMFINSTDGQFMQFRWYNGNPTYIRVMGSKSYTPNKDFFNNTIEAKFKIKLNPARKTFAVWINGQEFIKEYEIAADSSGELKSYLFNEDNFTNLKSISFDINNEANGIRQIKLDNFKVYSVVDDSTFAVGEEIYKHTFDGTTIDTSMVTVGGGVTASQANGVLSLSCDSSEQGKQTLIYLQNSTEALTGEYVVETVFKNPVYNTNQYHRLTFGTQTCYLRWSPSTYMVKTTKIEQELKYRHGNTYPDFTNQLSDFYADGKTLKVTHLYNTENCTVDVWYNDIYAGQMTAAEGLTAGMVSIPYINVNLYYGSIDVEEVHVYRPANYGDSGVKITEDNEKVTITSDCEKEGRLYFATYEGEDDAKTVSALGTAALSLEPGKVYTVSKADWAGAKAFFWNNNQQPIVDAWDLQ